MRITESLNKPASHYEIKVADDRYARLEEMIAGHILLDGVGPEGVTIYNHYTGVDGGYVNVYRYDVRVGLLRVPGEYVGETFIPAGYQLGDDFSGDPTILEICEDYFPGEKKKLWFDGNTGKTFTILRQIIDIEKPFWLFEQELAKLPHPLEIKNTADANELDELTVDVVVRIDGDICELARGSKWKISENSLSVGDQVRIVSCCQLKKIRSNSLVGAWIVDFPPTDHNVIEKIQHVRWGYMQMFSIVLKDGSRWLFDTFSENVGSWQIGDRVMLFKPNQRFEPYMLANLDRQTSGRLADYTLSASELPLVVWDKDWWDWERNCPRDHI